jgi:hypothetical protein
MEEEATSRGAGVDAVCQTHEVDPIPFEAAHEVHELLHTPPEPVELPDDERVAPSKRVERTQEPRTVFETALAVSS